MYLRTYLGMIIIGVHNYVSLFLGAGPMYNNCHNHKWVHGIGYNIFVLERSGCEVAVQSLYLHCAVCLSCTNSYW